MSSEKKLADIFFTFYEKFKDEFADTEAFVASAYERLIGLKGDFKNKDARIKYWAEELDSGNLNRENFGETFLDKAKNTKGDLIDEEDFQQNQVVVEKVVSKVTQIIEERGEDALTLDDPEDLDKLDEVLSVLDEVTEEASSTVETFVYVPQSDSQPDGENAPEEEAEEEAEEDSTQDDAPAASGGGGGGGGGGGTVDTGPTFTLGESTNGFWSMFSGTATGDITASMDGDQIAFTRQGITVKVDPESKPISNLWLYEGDTLTIPLSQAGSILGGTEDEPNSGTFITGDGQVSIQKDTNEITDFINLSRIDVTVDGVTGDILIAETGKLVIDAFQFDDVSITGSGGLDIDPDMQGLFGEASETGITATVDLERLGAETYDAISGSSGPDQLTLLGSGSQYIEPGLGRDILVLNEPEAAGLSNKSIYISDARPESTPAYTPVGAPSQQILHGLIAGEKSVPIEPGDGFSIWFADASGYHEYHTVIGDVGENQDSLIAAIQQAVDTAKRLDSDQVLGEGKITVTIGQDADKPEWQNLILTFSDDLSDHVVSFLDNSEVIPSESPVGEEDVIYHFNATFDSLSVGSSGNIAENHSSYAVSTDTEALINDMAINNGLALFKGPQGEVAITNIESFNAALDYLQQHFETDTLIGFAFSGLEVNGTTASGTYVYKSSEYYGETGVYLVGSDVSDLNRLNFSTPATDMSLAELISNDDFSADTDTSGLITFNSVSAPPVSGSIEVAGDQDWFKVTLREDAFYHFDIMRDGAGTYDISDAQLKLFDANGLPAQGNFYNQNATADSSWFFVKVAEAGDYYLAAEPDGRYQGDYTLSGMIAYQDAADTMQDAVQLDNEESGILVDPADQDWFKVAVTEGQDLQIELAARSNWSLAKDLVIDAVYDSSGNELTSGVEIINQVVDSWDNWQDDGAVSTNEVTLTLTSLATGDYYFAVTGAGEADGVFGVSTGGYSLDLSVI